MLIDPYAKGNTKTLWNRGDACRPGDNLGTSMRSVVIDTSDYDWEGDQPLNRPDERDDHLRDARRRLHQVADLGRRRTPAPSAGVIEKIPYLKELGVTAVELLPVFEFDDTETSARPSTAGR